MGDAECAQIRHFHCSVLNRDMEKKSREREYNLDLYKAYEKFESIARDDKKLIKEIAQNGFYKVVDQVDFVKETKARVASEDEKRHQEKERKHQEHKKAVIKEKKDKVLYKIKTNIANSTVNFVNGLRNNTK